ncbi:hypothetical protein SAMN05216490_4455 [Mucilaginibacter mallensis]|uniref:Uncharacterized protein n=1 Tax=Mucilaginibacter mallensis TaxID=652787 RepID=A0A1H2BXU5_MUCMA|nr:hypothetical protein SAMN05216490_4455 [Mucilaginibacter mallensis]
MNGFSVHGFIGVRKIKRGSIGLVRFPPWSGEGWGLTAYLVYKPLPAISHPTAPLSRGEGIKNRKCNLPDIYGVRIAGRGE